MDEQRLAEIDDMYESHGSTSCCHYGQEMIEALAELLPEVRRVRMENHGLRERVEQLERGPLRAYEDAR